MNLTIEPFDRKEDIGLQRRLFSECFPENRGLPPESMEFYLRKFGSFPADPNSFEYVARDEEGLVAYYAAIPYGYRIAGKQRVCGMVCDVMTAPRMRGMGVFTKLGVYSLEEMRKKGVDFVLGYPRRPEVIPGHLKAGWEIAFQLPLYILPLKSNSLLSVRGLKVLIPIVNAALRARCFLGSIAGDRYSFEICPWRDFLEKYNYDSFLDKWLSGRRNCLIKDRDYLNWRLSIQETSYHIAAVLKGLELVGVSIFRACSPDGVPSVGVLDIMIIDDERYVLATMRKAWIEYAKARGLETIIFMMSELRAKQKNIGRFGFIRSPVTFSLIIKRLAIPRPEEISVSPEDWDLMWIDSDDL